MTSAATPNSAYIGAMTAANHVERPGPSSATITKYGETLESAMNTTDKLIRLAPSKPKARKANPINAQCEERAKRAAIASKGLKVEQLAEGLAAAGSDISN